MSISAVTTKLTSQSVSDALGRLTDVVTAKMLVWDDNGQTKLSYTSPAELASRYALSDELSQRLAGIDALTDAALA